FSPERSVIVAAGHKAVLAWTAPGATPMAGVGSWGYGNNAIAFSPDGQRLAAGGEENLVRAGSVQGDPATLGKHLSVHCVAFRPDGKRVASGGADYKVRLWNVELAAEAKSFEGHAGRVYSVAFSPDGQWLASGSEDKTVRLWPLK